MGRDYFQCFGCKESYHVDDDEVTYCPVCEYTVCKDCISCAGEDFDVENYRSIN